MACLIPRDTHKVFRAQAIVNCGELFDTKNSNNKNYGANLVAGEHFAVDETGNCGELFVIGEI